jgi:hypothetical protein
MPDTPIALAGDNAVVTVTLPFPFPFYGQTYDQVHVSTNGNIHFGPANPSWTTYCLPNANIPRAMIAPFLDDLYVDSVGQIAQATVGVAPHRTWVVQWTNIRLQYELASRVTFQIQLSEGTGDIWTLYGPLSGFSGGGRLASVGIQDQTGTVGTQYSCADAVLHPTLTVHYGHR